MMDRSHLNQQDMKNCKLFPSLFTKGVQNDHHLHGHMPGDAFFTGQLQASIMFGQKSDHEIRPC